jgi:ribosomal protein S18 acetylase RimI-like enzyme
MTDIIQKVSCVQLSSECNLLNDQFKSISELIYDTDPFIYPAMFGNDITGRNNAITILTDLLIKGTDKMFCLDNFFVAITDNQIVGLILWYKGILLWDINDLLLSANENNITLKTKELEIVKNAYFGKNYVNGSDNARTSLINVCIKNNYRGLGIGSHLLKEFIGCHENEELELYVIRDNSVAIKLYQKNGFHITNQLEGFSLTGEKPQCYEMVRTP